MKTLSIIIPIYYGEQYLDNLLQQIEDCMNYLNKTEYSFEVLFVNDAPDAPITQTFSKTSLNVIVMNTNNNVGIHGARVKGLKRSTGEFILFLDQDDHIKPEYFSSQLLFIGENDAVVCQAIHANENFYLDYGTFKKMICKDFILGKWNSIVSPGQVLIRKKSIPTIWTENILKYNGADDWFLWLCMIAEKCQISLNYNILYEHVIQKANASDDHVSMLQSEQEVIQVIKEKEIFSDEDLNLLVTGFLKKHVARMEGLYKKIDSVCKHDNLLESWMHLRDIGIEFSGFFKKYGYKRIAIYGVGKLGKHLFCELSKGDIEVLFGIDQNSKCVTYPVPVYSASQQIEEVDAIVITVIDQYEEIKKLLTEKVNCAIIPLEKIIQELMPNG